MYSSFYILLPLRSCIDINDHLLYILQVSRSAWLCPSAPSAAFRANPEIGPSTVSDPSFTSEDCRTFSERQRGCLIYPAPDDASAVDYTKEDMDDDEDGVVNSSLVQQNPTLTTQDEQMPVITWRPTALEEVTPTLNPVVDDWSDLALLELNDAADLTEPRHTMSSGSDPRVQLSRSLAVTHRLLRRRGVKRYRGDVVVEGVVVRASEYTRSEEILSFQKDSRRDFSSQPRGAA